MIAKALLAFFGMGLADFLYVKYTQHAARCNAVTASHYATALFGTMGVVTCTYVDNHWMLIPAAAGAWCGTFLGCRS